jgi:DNA-binding transcriptional LysR family regulator
MHLSPVLDDFLAQFPDVSVNLELDNRYIEMISEGYDAATRVGAMEDSSLRAHQIAETTICMVASHGYLQGAGRPRRIEDLGA